MNKNKISKFPSEWIVVFICIIGIQCNNEDCSCLQLWSMVFITNSDLLCSTIN